MTRFDELTECWNWRRAQQDQAYKAYKALNTAVAHIEAQNYGLAKQSIREAQGRLPWDNGEYIMWPAVREAVTP
jgi:hypothetical protein